MINTSVFIFTQDSNNMILKPEFRNKPELL